MIHPDQLQDAIGDMHEAMDRLQNMLTKMANERLTGYITITGRGVEDEWQAICPYHGEIARGPMTLEGHSDVLRAWDQHEREHATGGGFAADQPLPEHLRVTKSDRGFARLPKIQATHGERPAGHAEVYESSAAGGPYLWLSLTQPADRNQPDGDVIEATVHMRAEDAWRFAEQIQHLVRGHYQGDAVPNRKDGNRE